MKKKTIADAMTWLPDVYALDKDRKTDAELLLEVHKQGYSRIPVYCNEKFVIPFRFIFSSAWIDFLQIECHWYC